MVTLLPIMAKGLRGCNFYCIWLLIEVCRAVHAAFVATEVHVPDIV